MDSLGYAIEEIVGLSELKDDLEEKSEWKRIARITILASTLLIFVAFVGYEAHQMIDSYSNPVWSSYESDVNLIPFPGIILCPGSPRFTNQTITHGSCVTFSGDEENETQCEPQTIEMVTSSYSKKPEQYCLNYNFNNSALASNSESYFVITSIINVDIASLEMKENHPLLYEILNSYGLQPNHNNSHNNSITSFPLYVQLYDASLSPPKDLVPSFLVSIDSTNYITLTRTEYHFRDKYSTTFYSASVSSLPNTQKGFQLLLWFSFGTTKVNIWEQTITLDWITGLGIIAGALGFLRSIYTIIFLIVDKIHEKCTRSPEKEKYELLTN